MPKAKLAILLSPLLTESCPIDLMNGSIMAIAPHSYEIRPESIKTFIEDRTVKLPRFQRKQTWDQRKDFALAISIFKGFPLGVVVINKEIEHRKPLKWLLDGRQRRNALMSMLNDPEVIYDWARKFLGFKQQSSEAKDIEDLFWEKIEDYLGADDEESDTSGESEPIQNDNESLENEENTGTPEDYRPGEKTKSLGNRYQDLDLLLRIILLSHKKNKKWSGFTRFFDFSDFTDNLDYVDTVENRQCFNSRKLRAWMLEYRNYCSTHAQQYLDKDTFFNYVKARFKKNEAKLKTNIDRNWERIKERFECIELIENKLQETKIGLIELSGANASDAQTTFKIINSSGTPLSAVEILSAKPSWNIPIQNPSAELRESTSQLYKAIDVTQDDVVKWDAPATFTSRLPHLRFLLSQFDYADGKQLSKAITVGFKMVSAIYDKGISKDHIDSLSTNPGINWQLHIDAAVKDFNDIGKILIEDPFFAYFSSWEVSLMDLTSDAIAIDFLIRTYFDWKRKNSPHGAGAQTKVFLQNSKILFDTLLYEYLTRQWRGSSDSRVADHIRTFDASNASYSPLSRSRWFDLLDEVIERHAIGGMKLKVTGIDPLLKPLLYYHYVLREQRGPQGVKLSIEIDHIIPQSILEPSTLRNKDIMTHNLFNLALLPKKDNISKGDKALNLLSSEWLKEQVELYASVPRDKFSYFSKAQNMDGLRKKRKQIFRDAFGPKRDALFVG